MGTLKLFFSMGQVKQHDHADQDRGDPPDSKDNAYPRGKLGSKDEICSNQESSYEYRSYWSHHRFCHPGASLLYQIVIAGDIYRFSSLRFLNERCLQDPDVLILMMEYMGLIS